MTCKILINRYLYEVWKVQLTYFPSSHHLAKRLKIGQSWMLWQISVFHFTWTSRPNCLLHCYTHQYVWRYMYLLQYVPATVVYRIIDLVAQLWPAEYDLVLYTIYVSLKRVLRVFSTPKSCRKLPIGQLWIGNLRIAYHHFFEAG